ncbi:MAG: alanine racemase, partial [Hydrogenobacter sp.]
MARAILEISADAIRHNIRALRDFSNKKIIAVVKADAYGMSAFHICSVLEDMEEVSSYAVACVEEGVELRKAGFKKDILILGGVLKGEERALTEYRLTPVVSHKEHLKAIEGLQVGFHVKYDTGMGRLGFLEEVIKDSRIKGILTHLSSPLDRDFSLRQIEEFKKIVKAYSSVDIHMESSAGVIYRVPFTTHIRIGLAMYGEKPAPDYPV